MSTFHSMAQVLFLALGSIVIFFFTLQANVIRGYANNRDVLVEPTIQPQRLRVQNDSFPKRSLLKESDTMPQLKRAFAPVENIVLPALGSGTDKDDPSLLPLDKNYRGIDWSMPQNQKQRENRIIYLITPTYKRQTQIVDLTRVSTTLRLARETGYHERLYWIILEDAPQCTARVRRLAIESGVPFAHRAVKTPTGTPPPGHSRPRHRGVAQRNMGLQIVEEIGKEGVVYFMDDDNAYHPQLFHEMSYITHVGVFGVGLPGGSAYERCHVDPKTGKVDKLLTTWKAPRKYPVDMAGFAFATHHLARNKLKGTPVRFSQDSLSGYLENDLLLFMLEKTEDVEPMAANCTRILAWHVKTVGNKHHYNPEADDETFRIMEGLL